MLISGNRIMVFLLSCSSKLNAFAGQLLTHLGKVVTYFVFKYQGGGPVKDDRIEQDTDQLKQKCSPCFAAAICLAFGFIINIVEAFIDAEENNN